MFSQSPQIAEETMSQTVSLTQNNSIIIKIASELEPDLGSEVPPLMLLYLMSLSLDFPTSLLNVLCNRHIHSYLLIILGSL